MALSFGPGGDENDEVMATINTTPLVDVMLVLLIIFLITIPVVMHSVPVKLPSETNQPTQTLPGHVTITMDRGGDVYWNDERLFTEAQLQERLAEAARQRPQPDVHIRGDQDARFATVGRIIARAQQAGITKLGFLIQPPPKGS